MRLEGRTALVTGASRGIGAAIADRLADEGARVIGTATSEDGAAAIAGRLQSRGIGLVLDQSDAASVDALLETCKAAAEDIGILVNNAAITRDNLALRMKDEEWEAVLRTNLDGVFRLVRGCLRGMTRARWGRIVNISSVVGSMGNAGQMNYAAAKAGLEGMSRALASEIAARGVTVNCIAPGFVRTDMTAALSEEQQEALLARVPAGRFGDAAEVAALAAFLASDESAYVTGETIHVNGGMYMG